MNKYWKHVIKKFDGFEFYSNNKRGYGTAHTIYAGDYGISIGTCTDGLQSGVHPEYYVDYEDIIGFFEKESPEKVMNFVKKYGRVDCSGLYPLYTWVEFKEAYKRSE